MKNRVVLSSSFAGDLDAIISHLEQYSITAANEFKAVVFPTLDDLALMPGKGSLKFPRSRRLRDIRSWPVRGFPKILIFYRSIENGIEVATVMHGARNIRSQLSRRLHQKPPTA